MNKVFGKQTDFAPIREDASRVIISYGYEIVDEENATWIEIYLYKKQISQVSLADVKEAIIADINARTDEKILTGFIWNEKPVWLSDENQRNFSEADRKAEKNPDILPIVFKIGEQDGTPVYHTFETYEELDGFYTQAFAYIQQCLVNGWTEKDGIDWEPYEALYPSQANAE